MSITHKGGSILIQMGLCVRARGLTCSAKTRTLIELDITFFFFFGSNFEYFNKMKLIASSLLLSYFLCRRLLKGTLNIREK